MHRQGDEQADGIPILVHGASVDTWNSGGKRQQTTVCFFLFAELVKSVNECDNEIQGTRVVHGLLLRIEFASTDSKIFVHKRLRWCRHSNRLSKALAAWNSQMPRRIQTTEILVETKLILEALTGVVGETCGTSTNITHFLV